MHCELISLVTSKKTCVAHLAPSSSPAQIGHTQTSSHVSANLPCCYWLCQRTCQWLVGGKHDAKGSKTCRIQTHQIQWLQEKPEGAPVQKAMWGVSSHDCALGTQQMFNDWTHTWRQWQWLNSTHVSRKNLHHLPAVLVDNAVVTCEIKHWNNCKIIWK